MVYWVSLNPEWRLQDVQAAINVVIALLCAGGTFVLVRSFWVSAARKVAGKKEVPVHSLFSLNTVGESIDTIWLLRTELFSRNYRSLLVQCVGVLLLTVAALLSGFIARYSTRDGYATFNRNILGTLASRNTLSAGYGAIEMNNTIARIKQAGIPQDQLLEFWPDPNVDWKYEPSQWNSSWSMKCSYNKSTEIANPRISSDCSGGPETQVPQLVNSYRDWINGNGKYTWDYEGTGWRVGSVWKDYMYFLHGLRRTDWDESLRVYHELEMRTVVIHLQGVPWNSTVAEGCKFPAGSIDSARYTSASCLLTRNLEGRSVEDTRWGAYPDVPDTGTSLLTQMKSFYSGRLLLESDRNLPISTIEGEEMVQFYQAYLILKDTRGGFASLTDATSSGGNTTSLQRSFSVRLRVPQVSLSCLILCCTAASIILMGLINYWFFLYRHSGHLDQTPQSKLDWMLQTLSKETDTQKSVPQEKLRHARTSGMAYMDTIPLSDVNENNQLGTDKKVIKSARLIQNPKADTKGTDTQIVESVLLKDTSSSSSRWFHGEYQPVGQRTHDDLP